MARERKGREHLKPKTVLQLLALDSKKAVLNPLAAATSQHSYRPQSRSSLAGSATQNLRISRRHKFLLLKRNPFSSVSVLDFR